MFGKSPILQEHKDRGQVSAIMHLVRNAANAMLDVDKWAVWGKKPTDYKDDEYINDSQYLPRFAFESNHSYCERLLFMTNYGYTQMVSDAYESLFSEAKIEYETNFGIAQDQLIEDNFDGQSTGLKEFAVELFSELLKSGRCPVVTDATDGLSYTYIIPRENMRNWAGNFNFLTWDGVRETVNDISVIYRNVISAYTNSEYREYAVDGDKVKEIINTPHSIGMVPIVDAWLGDGSPILKPLAVMDFNLMNLDSEMRRILRNQAGLNILQTYKGALKKLTDKTHIEIQSKEQDVSKWITYPASSMDSQFRYLESVQKTIFEISRLRRQKNMAETDDAKKLDFVNTKAVLVQGAKAVENAIQRSLEIRAKLIGVQSPRVKFEIDKRFDFQTLSEKMDEILKMIAASYPGPIIEKMQKSVIADKGGMSEKEIEEAYASQVQPLDQLSEVISEVQNQ